MWVAVNTQVNYPIRGILSNLVASDNIDVSNEVKRFVSLEFSTMQGNKD